MFAADVQNTPVALRTPRNADCPPMQHQTVAEIIGFLRREQGPQLVFNLDRVFAFRKPQQVG